MEKTFEEKFGLKTKEMETILGGVIDAEQVQSDGCSICSTCMVCTYACTMCSNRAFNVM